MSFLNNLIGLQNVSEAVQVQMILANECDLVERAKRDPNSLLRAKKLRSRIHAKETRHGCNRQPPTSLSRFRRHGLVVR